MGVTVDVSGWSGPPGALSDELERGRILFFPKSPLELPAEDDLAFLRSELPRLIERKNVSYYPHADRLVGLSEHPDAAARAKKLLSAHTSRVQAFLRKTLPELTAGWRVGTSSFRPLQEQGRNLRPHASNELVHVDAGAYGATHGDRILRFFVNVHPTEDRVWATRGPFSDLLARYGARAGVGNRGKLEEQAWDKARTGLLRAAEALGVSRATMMDSSPYDRAMRRFHNFMKDDPSFRHGTDGYEEMRFPPFSAWAVFTDAVSHACLSGQHALVDTFLIPLERCRLQALAPFHLLEGTSGLNVPRPPPRA